MARTLLLDDWLGTELTAVCVRINLQTCSSLVVECGIELLIFKRVSPVSVRSYSLVVAWAAVMMGFLKPLAGTVRVT